MEIILGRLMIITTVFLPILFASAFFVYGLLALWERVRGNMPEAQRYLYVFFTPGNRVFMRHLCRFH